MTLSIIVPTSGRPTLIRALGSVISQCGDGDEVIVVSDGPDEDVDEVCRLLDIRYCEGPKTGQWGNAQRQAGMAVAGGDYLLFLDDDDWFVLGAIDAVRRAIALHPGHPLIFRFVDKNGVTRWADRVVRTGNVSTQCLCVPNVKGQLGFWGDTHEGDFVFLATTLDRYPVGAEVWCDQIVQVAGGGYIDALIPALPGGA